MKEIIVKSGTYAMAKIVDVGRAGPEHEVLASKKLGDEIAFTVFDPLTGYIVLARNITEGQFNKALEELLAKRPLGAEKPAKLTVRIVGGKPVFSGIYLLDSRLTEEEKQLEEDRNPGFKYLEGLMGYLIIAAGNSPQIRVGEDVFDNLRGPKCAITIAQKVVCDTPHSQSIVVHPNSGEIEGAEEMPYVDIVSSYQPFITQKNVPLVSTADTKIAANPAPVDHSAARGPLKS